MAERRAHSFVSIRWAQGLGRSLGLKLYLSFEPSNRLLEKFNPKMLSCEIYPDIIELTVALTP